MSINILLFTFVFCNNFDNFIAFDSVFKSNNRIVKKSKLNLFKFIWVSCSGVNYGWLSVVATTLNVYKDFFIVYYENGYIVPGISFSFLVPNLTCFIASVVYILVYDM